MSPSSFAVFNVTTASRIFAPSLLKTEMVAFGGSLAKLSSLVLPGDHSSIKWDVSECPAARTGRSAKTMEFGATPVSVNFPPCRLAPPALITISDGTISGSSLADRFRQRHVRASKAVCASAGAPPGEHEANDNAASLALHCHEQLLALRPGTGCPGSFVAATFVNGTISCSKADCEGFPSPVRPKTNPPSCFFLWPAE